MSWSKPTISTLVVLAVVALGTGGGWFVHRALGGKPAARAARQVKPAGVEVKGVIQGMNAREGTLTIRLGKEVAGEKAFLLAKDAKVFLDDGTGGRLGFREGQVADLAVGMSLTLRLDEGGKVGRLWAEGPTVHGVLKSTDAARGTLTATVHLSKGEPAEDRTFPLAKTAKLFLDDGKGKDAVNEPGLADLPAGAVVHLRLSADRKGVGGVRVEGPTLAGLVKAVDADKGTVTVTVQTKGEPEQDKTFTLAKEGYVLIRDGKKKDKRTPDRLTDLPVGASVTLRLSPDQAFIVALHAEGASAHGTAAAIDTANDTITVSHKGEGDKTYTVSKDAAVFLDGQGGKKLADVPAESVVYLKFLVDQKTVGEVHASGPTVHGTVSGTASKDGITISSKGGDSTYAVSDGVLVLIEEKRVGKLADLIDGTVVQLRLSAGKSEVLEVRAEGPTFKGTVKAVDADKGTITLTIGAKNGVGGEDKDFKLAKDTVVTESSGAPMKLADLKVDTEVVLRLSLDQKGAARITVGGE